jgi:hypothetical protein
MDRAAMISTHGFKRLRGSSHNKANLNDTTSSSNGNYETLSASHKRVERPHRSRDTYGTGAF